MKNLYAIPVILTSFILSGCGEEPDVPLYKGFYLAAMPSWLKEAPDTVKCTTTNNYTKQCLFESIDSRSSTIKLIDTDGGEWIDNSSPYQTIDCKGDFCSYAKNNDYYGQEIGRWGMERTRGLRAPIGFYVMVEKDSEGKEKEIYFHKRGTGPMADQYPMYSVKSKDDFPKS